MTTTVTDSPEEAAAYLRSGELVAFPTETVYGLGADAFNEAAIRGIFKAKGRPYDNPVIVHVSDLRQIELVAAEIPREAELLIERFFPGPLTIILYRAIGVSDLLTAGLNTVGVRMPSHPTAQQFLAACGIPVAAPSANRSGRPSPTTWEDVRTDLEGRIPCILRGGRTPVGLESTVVDCTTPPALLLRAGAVPAETIRSVIGSLVVEDAPDDRSVRSPGMRHRHYAPRAAVVLVDRPPAAPPERAAYIGLDAPASTDRYDLVRTCSSFEEYAYELFDFFRRCDEAGISTIVCQRVDESGMGLALMDRLRRASEGAPSQ